MNKKTPILFLVLGFFIIVLIWYAVMMVNTPKQILNPLGNTPPSQTFVTAHGRALYRNSRVFQSIGVNRYNLLSSDTETNCGNIFSESDIDTMFSQFHTLGITTVRFWLFQSFTRNGDDLTRFDYVLDTAKKYGITVIPVFENHWNDCTQGGVKTADWYASGYRSPYGNYSLSLKDYIEKIVTKYTHTPTILMWQIMNEAQDSDTPALAQFAADTSGEISSMDANHLISFGTTGAEPANDVYRKISSLPTVNLIDYHDYDNDTDPLPSTLMERFRDSQEVGKPIMVDESGIKSSVSNRADALQTKIHAFFKEGGSVYLIWSYGNPGVIDDGYNFSFSDPVSQVIKNISRSK